MDAQASFAEGRYVARDILGAGGMALVLRVVDTRLEVERALKCLHLTAAVDSQARARMAQEAQIAASLLHPHVVTVFDSFVEEGRPCTVMELCRGSLADWVRARGPLAPAVAVRTMLGVLSALEAAHGRGAVHRDVKPDNLLIAGDGTVKLGDFGVARLRDAAGVVTHTGAALGSLAFMAPEQRREASDVGPEADVYGAAGAPFWLMTAQPPFELHVAERREGLLGLVPAPLRDTLDLALAYEAGERTPSAGALAESLESALETLPEAESALGTFVKVAGRSSLSTIPPSALPTPALRRVQAAEGRAVPGWALALGGAVAALLVALPWLSGGGERAPAPPVESSAPPGVAVPGPNTLRHRQAEALERQLASAPDCAFAPHTFVQGPTILAPRETKGARFADLDQDGHMDAVFTNQMAETLSVYWGDGKSRLSEVARREIPIGRAKSEAAVGDLNADGHLDLLVSEPDRSRFAVVFGEGGRAFSEPRLVVQDEAPERQSLTDWNEDGHLDIIPADSNYLYARFGRGDGTFEPRVILLPMVRSFVLADLEGSGVRQLIADVEIPSNRGNFAAQTLIMRRGPDTSPANILTGLSSVLLGKERIMTLPIPGTKREAVVVRLRGVRNTMVALTGSVDALEICSLVHAGVVDDQQEIRDVGDFDADGLPDLLATMTCTGCESNHILYRGTGRLGWQGEAR